MPPNAAQLSSQPAADLCDQRYQVGAGEQGVLSVQPFKNEILPFWRFKDPPAARESSQHIYGMFCAYRDAQVASARRSCLDLQAGS